MRSWRLLAAPVVAAVAALFVQATCQAEPSFTVKSAAIRDGAGLKIAFAVTEATDAEVAVLGADGKIVRHLAAGLLGENAPAPFKKGSLSQTIAWDGTDDAGQKLAAPGPLKVRVSIGAKPKLDKYAGWDGNTLGGIVGLAVGKDGELFVMISETFRGGTDLRVLDKTGKYLRTIMPYPANTPKARTDSVGALDVEGERLPIVFNAVSRTVYPLTAGMRQQNIAMHPKGYLVMVSALGTMNEQGPPRYLLAVHPQGGAPEGVNFVGPRLRGGRAGMVGGAGESTVGLFDHVALSPDGESVYVSVCPNGRFDRKKENGVLRLKWSDKEAGPLFLGQDSAGADDTHFNDPEGLAVDPKGNLYVCDWGNNRVMIFTPDGKLRGKFPVEQPQQIAVNPTSGEIYTMSLSPNVRWATLWADDAVIRKFSPWGEKELAKVECKGFNLMALDTSAAPAKLWLAGSKGLVPVLDKGGQLEAGARVDNANSMSYPTYIAGDPARNRALVYENGTAGTQQIWAIDLDSGAKKLFCKGTDMALDRDGNVNVYDGHSTNSISRFDPAGKPLPFSGIGSNKIATKGYRGYGPNMGLPGLAITPNGDLYVMRTSNYGTAESYGGRVDIYGPDGKLKKEGVLDGMGYGDCGLGVDAAGNMYVGVNVKPADKPFPAPFMGKVPDKGWTWWGKPPPRDVPWNYPFVNSYLFYWGSVFKFGPKGGAFYGQHPWNLKDPKYGQPKPTDVLANAPADAVSYRSSYLSYEVKVAGALWRYAGCGIVPSSGDGLMPDPGCVCLNSHLAVDEYGRVFAPNVFRFSVEMLDSNGNQVARIGRYGNADGFGPGAVSAPGGATAGAAKSPAKAAGAPGSNSNIAFVWPAHVSVAGGKVFVSDTVNRRVVVVGFDHAAEETCEAK